MMISFLSIPSCKDENHNWPQIVTVIIVCLITIITGTLFAWTSPSIPILISNSSEIDPLTKDDCSYFGIMPSIGILLGTPVVAVLGKFLSNKVIIMSVSVPQTVAWLLIILAKTRWEFYISRFLTGVTETMIFLSLPAYIAEISTPEIRGIWGCLISIFFFSGHLIINVVGAYFTIRITAYIFVAIPSVIAILIFFLPESPYHYIRKKDIERAKRSLQILRWRNNVDEELSTLLNNVQQQPGTLKDLFLVRKNRFGLFIAIGTRVVQQFSGFAVIVYYNQFIFNESGSSISGFQSSVIYSSLQVVLICIFSYNSDKIGRKRALIFSSIGCGLSLAIEGTYFFIYQKLQLDVSFIKWLPLLGLLMYMITFSFGLSSVPSLLLGEVINASVKVHSISIVNITYGISLLLCTYIFSILTSNVGMYAPFWLYSVCCFFGSVYFYYCIPETNGKTLYEIEKMCEESRSTKTQSN